MWPGTGCWFGTCCFYFPFHIWENHPNSDKLIEIETTNQGMSWNVGSYLDILNHVAVWQISADQSHGYPDGFSWRWDSNIDGCKIGSPRYHGEKSSFCPSVTGQKIMT